MCTGRNAQHVPTRDDRAGGTAINGASKLAIIAGKLLGKSLIEAGRKGGWVGGDGWEGLLPERESSMAHVHRSGSLWSTSAKLVILLLGVLSLCCT